MMVMMESDNNNNTEGRKEGRLADVWTFVHGLVTTCAMALTVSTSPREIYGVVFGM